MTSTLWLIGLPLILSPAVYLAGHIPVRRLLSARGLTLAGMVGACALFVQVAYEFRLNGPIETRIGAMALRADGISLLLTAAVLVLGTLVVVYSSSYMAGEIHQEKYYALLITMIGAMIGLACASDLFNLWVWFETMTVSSYLLVAFYRQQPASLEAGVKYLVQSMVGSVLVLLGIALVLLETGSITLADMHNAAASPGLLAAGALFVIGFGVKVALVPLHTWLPDAHAQAPSGISALLSGVVIEAGLIALLRVLMALANTTPSWSELLMGFGAINMLAGNLLALRQSRVKRLLAFSSLSHIGYMLLGLGIAFYSGQAVGAQGALFHVLTHSLMKGLAFLSAGALVYGLHLAHGDHTPLAVSDLRGAASRYPLVAFTFSVALLGLGGLPPLAGFMSKWQIFVAGFEAENGTVALLMVFAAFNSVLSLAYYAPLVNVLYQRQTSNVVKQGFALPYSMQLPLLLLALSVIVIGIWPGLLNWLTEPAGAAVVAVMSR